MAAAFAGFPPPRPAICWHNFGACMKVFLFAAVLVLAAPPAMAIGVHACADAGIRGHIIRQTYERVQIDDPNVIFMNVLFHITVRVKTVLFGPIHKRTVLITDIAHTELNNRTRTFYLFRHKKGGWSFANCDLSDRRRRGP
jgi:hypothetical protein